MSNSLLTSKQPFRKDRGTCWCFLLVRVWRFPRKPLEKLSMIMNVLDSLSHTVVDSHCFPHTYFLKLNTPKSVAGTDSPWRSPGSSSEAMPDIFKTPISTGNNFFHPEELALYALSTPGKITLRVLPNPLEVIK